MSFSPCRHLPIVLAGRWDAPVLHPPRFVMDTCKLLHRPLPPPRQHLPIILDARWDAGAYVSAQLSGRKQGNPQVLSQSHQIKLLSS
jgi:hypothetical protein